LTTLAQSIKATPKWYRFFQPSYQDVAFDKIAPRTGERIGPLLLACRVTTSKNMDVGSGADMRIRVKLDKLPPFSVWGTDDADSGVFTIPLVRLQTGASMSVTVSDEDLTGSEPIGNLTLHFRGKLPMIAKDSSLGIECRGMPRKDFEPKLPGALELLDESLRQVKRLSAIKEDSLRLVTYRFGHAAGLVGWADPRLQKRILQLNEVIASWKDATRKKVVDLRPPRPVHGEKLTELAARLAPADAFVAGWSFGEQHSGGIELAVAAVECGAAAEAYKKHPKAWKFDHPFDCLIRLRGRARSSVSCTPSRCGDSLSFGLVAAGKQTHNSREFAQDLRQRLGREFTVLDLIFEGRPVHSVKLDEGELFELVLLPKAYHPARDKSFAEGKELHLLRWSGGDAVYLRLPHRTRPPPAKYVGGATEPRAKLARAEAALPPASRFVSILAPMRGPSPLEARVTAVKCGAAAKGYKQGRFVAAPDCVLLLEVRAKKALQCNLEKCGGERWHAELITTTDECGMKVLRPLGVEQSDALATGETITLVLMKNWSHCKTTLKGDKKPRILEIGFGNNRRSLRLPANSN